MNYAMPRTIYTKTFIFLAVFLCLSATLKGAEDDVLRDITERFVRQIEVGDTDAILRSYPMTNEFRAGMPNAATVTEWAKEIDRLFGRLGDIVNSEIVEHRDQGLRSVYLYYQGTKGTKRPAKIWVTFSGTVIAGFHYNVWEEGYAEREKCIIEWLADNISLIVVIAFCALLVFIIFLGQKEPTVKIIDSGIKISCIWGVKIDFAEIADISLMEDRIGSIGITIRTFGYAMPNTQKGYFLSNRYGSVLLFTKTKSSPTIHIEREDKSDVFLNFSDNEKTRTLYADMKKAFGR